MKQQELEHSKANLGKADEEIEILRNDKHRMGEQIVGERNNMMEVQAKHKEDIELLKLRHSYESETQKSHCVELEKILLKKHSLYSQFVDSVIKCHEEGRMLTKEELQEAQKNQSVS